MAITQNGLKWFNTSFNGGSLFAIEVKKTDENTIISWNGPSYIVGINMIQVFRNGVLLEFDTYNEVSGNSIEYLDNDANPIEYGDVFMIRYIPGKVSLGNILIADNYGELETIPNVVNGTIAITTNDKKFWIYKVDHWEEFVIPFTTQNIGILFENEEQPITGQTTYTLNTIQYNPGMGDLIVFIDGKKIDPSLYTEVDSSTIVFNTAPTGSEIQFLVGNSDSWIDSFNSVTIYEYDNNNNIIREKVTLENGTMAQDTHYTYNNNQDIIKEVVVRGVKTITRIYGYNSESNLVSCETQIG